MNCSVTEGSPAET